MIFREVFLGEFLSLLLNVLIAGTHGLLEEEIVGCVHSLAMVDFTGFYNEYLQHYISTQCTGVDSHQQLTLTNNSYNQDDHVSHLTQRHVSISLIVILQL